MERDKKTERNFNDYSDLHKEVYGYRPDSDVARGFRELSYGGQNAAHASLEAMGEEAARGKKKDEFDLAKDQISSLASGVFARSAGRGSPVPELGSLQNEIRELSSLLMRAANEFEIAEDMLSRGYEGDAVDFIHSSRAYLVEAQELWLKKIFSRDIANAISSVDSIYQTNWYKRTV
jgi:hypothetical protein